MIAVRDAIAAGELGRVVRTHGYGVHADWGPGGWFIDPALAGGGALVDMGIHAIDTARFLLGEPEARRVRASITTAHGDYAVDDDGLVLIEWEGGARSVVESGWWQPHLGGHEADTEVYGSSGYRRIWAREQPPGYVHCDVALFIAQLRDALRADRRVAAGDAVAAHGLAALRICEQAYAAAGVRLRPCPLTARSSSPASPAACAAPRSTAGCCARPIESAPEGMTIEPLEIRDLPHYDADLDVDGGPEVVRAFKAAHPRGRRPADRDARVQLLDAGRAQERARLGLARAGARAAATSPWRSSARRPGAGARCAASSRCARC